MIKISACIIVKNEERFIKDCLDSLQNVVDEIIIVDDYSNDKTVDICRNYTDIIYKRKMDNFASQRNFALSKTTSDWVFFIDADERLSPELHSFLKSLDGNNEYDCYAFSRRTYIRADYWVKHGRFYPDYQMRLFKRKSLKGFKNVIHEVPMYEGKIKKIKLDIIHHQKDRSTVYNAEMYKEYLQYELKKRNRERSRFYYMGKAITEFVYNFLKIYIWYQGYKDDYLGFIEAWRWAKYRFLVNLAIAIK